MHIELRPYLTTGVVLVGASVLVVAPLQIPPQELRPAELTVAIQPVALQQATPEQLSPVEAFALYAQAVGDTAYGVSNWFGTMPAVLVDLARQVAEDPRNLPAALSAVIYRLVYLRAASADPELVRLIDPIRFREVSLLAAATFPLLGALAQTLPAPLGGREGLITTSTQQLARSIATLLAALLPEPLSTSSGGNTPSATLIDDGAPVQSPVDELTDTIAELAEAVGLSARNTAYWVGALPGALVSLTEQVIAHPELLPNALSTLAHSLFALPDYSPDVIYLKRALATSLLGGMVDPYIRAFNTVLPPPLGGTKEETGLVWDLAAVASDVVNGALRNLPRPLGIEGDTGAVFERASMEVQKDPLLDLADAVHLVVSGLGDSAASVLAFTGSLPMQLTGLAEYLHAHPDKLPNVLSSIAYSLVALPDDAKEAAAKVLIRQPISLLDAALTPLARNLVQLPGPIGSTNGDPGAVELSMAALTKAVNGGLRLLPDPVRRVAEQELRFAAEPPSPLNQFNEDFALALGALGRSVASVADDLGTAPRTTIELTRAVAKDPRLLPRAVSTVAWEANALREGALRPVVEAVAQIAPPPLGDSPDVRGIAIQSFGRANEQARRALSRLPERLPIGSDEQYLNKISDDGPADAGVVTRKVKRPLVSLDLKAKAHVGSASAGRATLNDDGSTAKHRPGIGKRPVADHIATRIAERRAAHAAK